MGETLQEDKEVPVSRKEVINRLRKLRHPGTIFGEIDLDRYNRLLSIEEKLDDNTRKSYRDESIKSFLPEESEVE